MSGEKYTQNISQELVNLTISTFNSGKYISKQLDHIELIADEKYAKLKTDLSDLIDKIDPSRVLKNTRDDLSSENLEQYRVI